MKHVISLILALIMCLSLCACSQECSCGCAYCCGAEAQSESNASVQAAEATAPAATGQTEPDRVAYRYDGTVTGEVTVEEVVVRPHKVGNDGSLYFDWEVKVRNTGHRDTIPGETVLRIWFHYLDENGDIIETSPRDAGMNSPVKNQQAAWIQISGRLSTMNSSEVEATAFIEIFAYSTKYAGSADVYYEDPILIDIRPFVKK